MAKIHKGTIVEFVGSWSSGLATLRIEDAEGITHNVPCDNGPLGRALISAFGANGGGHTIDNTAIRGKEIYWAWDDMGLYMSAFTPVEEASPELVEAYENQ